MLEEYAPLLRCMGRTRCHVFSLAAQVLPNSQQMTTEAILSARKQEISGAEANMNRYRA